MIQSAYFKPYFFQSEYFKKSFNRLFLQKLGSLKMYEELKFDTCVAWEEQI